MRLTDTERQILRDAARDAFGNDTKVYLFGSRVDDTKRGGDIDLLVCLDARSGAADTAHLARQRVRYLVLLEKALGERKIDLVTALPDDERPIVRVAKTTGVEL